MSPGQLLLRGTASALLVLLVSHTIYRLGTPDFESQHILPPEQLKGYQSAG